MQIDDHETLGWFHDSLLEVLTPGGASKNREGVTTAQALSSQFDASLHNVGILTNVATLGKHSIQGATPRVTEVLFYASRPVDSLIKHETSPNTTLSKADEAREASDLSPKSDPSLCALLLSSDLLYRPAVENALSESMLAPLPDVQDDETVYGRFLPPFHEVLELEEVSRKKIKLSELFDDASTKRRNAKRRGPPNSLLTATKDMPFASMFNSSSNDNHFSTSTADPTPVHHLKPRHRPSSTLEKSPLETNARSRSSSLVTESRPASSRGQVPEKKRTQLSHLTEASHVDDTSIEARNKKTISRVVMAGMRIYGLTQRKVSARRDLNESYTPMELIRDALDDRDDEYKLVYYQTYKGTAFAFVRMLL